MKFYQCEKCKKVIVSREELKLDGSQSPFCIFHIDKISYFLLLNKI